MNNYRIYYEPIDVTAENPEEAMRKVKYTIANINKVIVVDDQRFPLER